MIKAGIDQDALITMFAEAGAKQGEALRKAVTRRRCARCRGAS
jgi:hypothetical protein